MAAHIRLCNIVRNISTNISTLGQRTHLKLGELFSLFIDYNTTIFSLSDAWFLLLFSIECVRCHAIENKIKNLSSDEVKILWYCRR